MSKYPSLQIRMRYEKQNKVYKAAEYVSEYCSLQQVQQIKRMFDLFDRDMGQKIDYRQFKVAINSLGIEKKAQSFYVRIRQLDYDKVKLMQFDQFFKLITLNQQTNYTRQSVHEVFKTFDWNMTGYLSLKDLRRVSKTIEQTIDDIILQQMIEIADKDQDGLVSEDQLYNLLTKKIY